MAGFLDPSVLRARAAPVNPGAARPHANAPRPVLIAHWRIAPDGRLICWRACRPATFPPPD